MNDGFASTLADIDSCAVDLERVKNAVSAYLEIIYHDMRSLRQVDNALVQSCGRRFSESLAVIELASMALGTTVNLLTDSVNRLYQSQGAQPNSTTADN